MKTFLLIQNDPELWAGIGIVICLIAALYFLRGIWNAANGCYKAERRYYDRQRERLNEREARGDK